MVFILKNQDFNVNEESVTKQLETMHFLHHSISHLLHLFIVKLGLQRGDLFSLLITSTGVPQGSLLGLPLFSLLSSSLWLLLHIT